MYTQLWSYFVPMNLQTRNMLLRRPGDICSVLDLLSDDLCGISKDRGHINTQRVRIFPAPSSRSLIHTRLPITRLRTQSRNEISLPRRICNRTPEMKLAIPIFVALVGSASALPWMFEFCDQCTKSCHKQDKKPAAQCIIDYCTTYVRSLWAMSHMIRSTKHYNSATLSVSGGGA